VQRIALTTGEPAGIGPDLTVMLAQRAHDFELVAVGNAELLRDRAKALALPLNLQNYCAGNKPEASKAGVLSVLDVELAAPVKTGSLNSANAAYVLKTLDLAFDGCSSKQFDAMVTAPVHKGVINDAGIDFTGHTEYLADKTGSDPVMVLASDNLRVALVTTHLPLSAVPEAITPSAIERVVSVLQSELQSRFAIANPHILVCGLNPHAGEQGHLGREEIDTIIPTLEKLRKQGMNLTGPLPADTLFTAHHLSDADAVLAMFHDQGLPVLKYAGFGKAVNVTFPAA